MNDSECKDSTQESPTDLRAEWDRLDATESGGQPAPAPDPAAEAPAAAEQDDQGQASRPPAEPAADKPAGNEPQTDIWANAPPELKAAYEADKQKWEQASRSAGGRAQAEARRNADLAAELAALREKQPAKEKEEEAPVLTEEQRTALKDEYPDVAGPLLDLIAGLERKQQRLEEAGASQQEQRQAAQELETQRHYAAEEQRLSEGHPDWLEVVKQPGFATWVETQPRMVKEALARNANQITDADEATDIIGRYKSTLPKVDDLQARREAQGRGLELPKSRTTVPTTSTTTDTKSEWERLEALDRQRDAQRAGARATR